MLSVGIVRLEATRARRLCCHWLSESGFAGRRKSTKPLVDELGSVRFAIIPSWILLVSSKLILQVIIRGPLLTVWLPSSVGLQDDFFNAWFAYLASAALGVFSNTKTLEIRRWYTLWPAMMYYRKADNSTCVFSYFYAIANETRVKQSLDPLLRFSGLEELRLIEWIDVPSIEMWTHKFCQWPMHEDGCRIPLVLEYLEEHKKDFGGKAPRVVIQEE